MEFNIPTTKDQLIATLKDIFYYYRIRREAYDGVILEDIKLNRQSYTILTEEEIREKAEKLTAVKQYKEKQEYLNNISARLEVIDRSLKALERERENELYVIETAYEKSKELIEEKVFANGFIQSTVMIDKIAELEEEKNTKLANVHSLYSERRMALNDEKVKLQYDFNGADDYFSAVFEKEIEEKIVEIRDEQIETQREIFRYNNGLDEKEKRSKNSNITANANLKIAYMEINGQFFSKDQLVEMGYYDDVLECVCGYYDRLDPLTAYEDFKRERTLKLYLDDYYQNTLYLYQMRAVDATETV